MNVPHYRFLLTTTITFHFEEQFPACKFHRFELNYFIMSNPIYYSTNRTAPEVGFAEALWTGQAPDLGLYMPKFIPRLMADEIAAFQQKSYAQIAASILSRFTAPDFDELKLLKLTEDAYDFDVPFEPAGINRWVMRLDRGPTASFKDFAAKMMGRLFGELVRRRGEKLHVLTATSGDTGGAVAHAFFGVPGVRVTVLFPVAEVTGRQRRQMTTLGGNVTAVAVDGKFDDCQALAKRAFADPELSHLGLTSANSINIGRLLPQTVYYFYAHSRLVQADKPIVFSVPSGNFGDMMGAVLAVRMGLPVSRLVIATNSNDEFPRFLSTGEYQKIVPSRAAISNAMNVGHPSNLARLVDLYGGWMDQKGKLNIPPDMDALRRDLWSVSIGDEETRETIRNAWEKHELLLEPHGAVAWAGLERFVRETKFDGPAVSVETADPAKFPEEIEQLLGFEPPVPPSLSGLDGKTENVRSISSDYPELKSLLHETP
jgi:threonine synthase